MAWHNAKNSNQIVHFWKIWVKGSQTVHRLSKSVDIYEEALNELSKDTMISDPRDVWPSILLGDQFALRCIPSIHHPYIIELSTSSIEGQLSIVFIWRYVSQENIFQVANGLVPCKQVLWMNNNSLV